MPRNLRLANDEAIKRLRKKLNLSQADFAARYDVAERWISKIERCEGLVDETALRELAVNLGVAFDDIVVPEGEEDAYLQGKTGRAPEPAELQPAKTGAPTPITLPYIFDFDIPKNLWNAEERQKFLSVIDQ